jgi:hypothetical protein
VPRTGRHQLLPGLFRFRRKQAGEQRQEPGRGIDCAVVGNYTITAMEKAAINDRVGLIKFAIQKSVISLDEGQSPRYVSRIS